jgi:WhiB family transcriptional regulator, redox-sensing transcriptional regulator
MGNPENWRSRANCIDKDPEAFYPGQGESNKAAKFICSHCDVRGDCLQEAMASGEEYGVWGGLSERERRKLLEEGSQAIAPDPIALSVEAAAAEPQDIDAA